MDAGIDSDMGIYINGGTVLATGHMLDRIENGGQVSSVLYLKNKVGGKELILKNEEGEKVAAFAPENDCSVLVYSSPDLAKGEYTLWYGDAQVSHQGGKMHPAGMPRPEKPEGVEPPEGFEFPERPQGRPPKGMPKGN